MQDVIETFNSNPESLSGEHSGSGMFSDVALSPCGKYAIKHGNPRTTCGIKNRSGSSSASAALRALIYSSKERPNARNDCDCEPVAYKRERH